MDIEIYMCVCICIYVWLKPQQICSITVVFIFLVTLNKCLWVLEVTAVHSQTNVSSYSTRYHYGICLSIEH